MPKTLLRAMTAVETAKLHGLDPQATDILKRVAFNRNQTFTVPPEAAIAFENAFRGQSEFDLTRNALSRLHDHMFNRLDQRLPRNRAPVTALCAKAPGWQPSPLSPLSTTSRKCGAKIRGFRGDRSQPLTCPPEVPSV